MSETKALKVSPITVRIQKWENSIVHIPYRPGERLAECCYCQRKSFSQDDLPHFKARPEQHLDSYMCGCRGWG